MKVKNWIVQIYLFLMLGVFPLYYQNRYYDMGDAKYTFFKYATITMLVVMGIWLIFEKLQTVGIRDKNKSSKSVPNISIQDITVLAYMGVALISWLISPYRENGWIGSHEWYMGLLSQLLFVGIYFVISRNYGNLRGNLWILGVSGAIVFIISYLHRFRIDPLGMYEGVAERYWLSYLGTIGNANWYSSYICVILPIMMGWYIFGESRQTIVGKTGHVLGAGFIFLGFATTVTQNSDSAYVGLALCMLFLLWFALENSNYLLRFFEVALFGLAAAKITGYLQITFPEYAMRLSTISTEITKGDTTWYVFGIVFLLYVLLQRWKNMDIAVWNYIKRIRNIFFIVLIIMILAVPVFMWLVSTERIVLDNEILSQTGYLMFDDRWGTNRGKIWKYALRIYKEYPLGMKLFGCGPDSLMYYSGEFHQTEVQMLWEDVILTNVHNEWLNMLINYGILGMSAYVSIYIVCIWNVFKQWNQKPVMAAFGASVLAYMGHNFFCFQQVVCTSLIFIVIAIMEKCITSE